MSKKTLIFLLFSLLYIFPPVYAQLGVGITTYRITLLGNVGEVYIIPLGVMNPSSYTTKVHVVFECLNCEEPVYLFGLKLFEKVEDPSQYFTLDKEMIEVPPNTNADNAIPVQITFTPRLLIRKYLKFYTPEWLNFYIRLVNKGYPGSFSVPYFTLLIGKKELEGKVAADVLEYDGMRPGVIPSVAAHLNMTAYGMPFESFLFLVLAISVAIFLILRKKLKKAFHKLRTRSQHAS